MFNLPNRNRGPSRFGAFVVFLAMIAVPLAATPQHQDSNVDVDPRAHEGLRISLDGLLRFLGSYERDGVSEAMVIKIIEMHALAFRPTLEDLAKLRKASASVNLLKAIEMARKPPPPKPVVARNGQLAVACQPVDCDVWLNGNLIGSTSHGQLPFVSLSEGQVTVSAMSPSYDPDSVKQEPLIRPNETTRVQFKFKPSRSALMAAGTKLFGEMLDSLGVNARASQPEAVRVAGTLSVHDGGGHRTAWSVVAFLREADAVRFRVARLREKYEITRTEAGYLWNKSPKTKEAHQLEDAIPLAVDGLLSRLIQRLKNPGLTMIAVDLTPGTESSAVLRAEGSPDTYVITLDSERRLSEVRLESPGLNSGARMLYSDYIQQGGVSYPKTTQVILPDGARGVETRFDTVQISPSQNSYPKARSK